MIKELLNYYSTFQELTVVYRPNPRVDWGRNRKIYDGICDLEYNHRTILNNEVVFDFDNDKESVNKDNALKVCETLDADNINYSLWFTGNKGYHIHAFWKDLSSIKELSLMKRIILKYYAWGMDIDYQLAGKHLVRMEYGIHEKKRSQNKILIRLSNNCLTLIDCHTPNNNLLKIFWEKYAEEINNRLIRKLEPTNTPELDDTIKKILNGKIMLRDGRKNMLWFLIHQLKGKMTQEEVTSKLISWYKYNGGTELTDGQISFQVRYQWDRTYHFGRNFLDLLLKNSVLVEE